MLLIVSRTFLSFIKIISQIITKISDNILTNYSKIFFKKCN